MISHEDEIRRLREERDMLKNTLAKSYARAAGGGKTFAALGRLLVDELSAAIDSAVVFRDALRRIAESPCLDPEGNADIARTALAIAPLHVFEGKRGGDK